MQKKLNLLKENSLLEISNWWGLRNAGYAGTIITKDKMLYSYTFYHRETPFIKEHNIPIEFISKGIKLSDKEMKKVEKFIEENILNKTFTSSRIFDAGYNVRINYNNQIINIINNKGFLEEKGLYDITKEFIDKIKGEKKDEK